MPPGAVPPFTGTEDVSAQTSFTVDDVSLQRVPNLPHHPRVQRRS
ncbi:hypothetical protein ACF1B0_04250 [Streptomyces anandii]